MCAASASFKVFSSPSSSASGENSGLPFAENIAGLIDVAGSLRCNEAPAGLRLGVHGTMNGAGTAVVGDEVETCGGGGDDVRKTSAAAAMMGAAVLVPTLTLLMPIDTRRGCVDAGEGRADTGRVTGDGCCCSAAARPCDLRRFAHFRSNPLACSRAFSASLRARASAEMRGFVAVVVRAHSGTTYGFFTTAGAGVGFGVGTDVSALNVALAGAA
jgi:hypothetical protein